MYGFCNLPTNSGIWVFIAHIGSEIYDDEGLSSPDVEELTAVMAALAVLPAISSSPDSMVDI